MPEINTNIKSNLTPDEKEVFSVIKEVIGKYAPSTEAYVAGGWVRDKLLGVESDDIDIMLSNMSGEDFAKFVAQHMNINDAHVIRENPEKSKHVETAKMHIPLSSGTEQELDFVRARTEVYDDESRIPTEVNPATPQEDAARRDLTINALFYDIAKGEVADFTGQGIKDLLTGTIRAPGNPLDRFFEDPLRVIRTIRFAAKYDGQIEPETYKAMLNPEIREKIIKMDVSKALSKDRIGQEIKKMLKNPNAEYAIELLEKTGLWQDLVTESLTGTKYEGQMSSLNMEQNNPWHTLTVWGHTMQVVKNILEKYPEAEAEKRATMIMAALMHDMGKLYSGIQGESKSHPGKASYHGHEKESKEIAEHILRYLKMEPFIQQVSGIARNHMRPHFEQKGTMGNLRAMRRFIRQMGEQSLDWLDVFNLGVADAYSKGVDIDPKTIQTYQELELQLQQALASLKPIENESLKPILNGNEVMQILNIKPGKWMSEIMEFVKELKDENPDITKEEATNILINKYQNINMEDVRQASKEDDMSSVCPMHLLKSKIKDVNTAFGEENYYKILQIIKKMKDEYGNDDNVLRFMAISTFRLLLNGDKYKDNDVLGYLFSKAEKNFFDIVLCSYVLGILILFETPTEDEVIREIAERMIKMSPGTIKKILESLPKDVGRPNLKKEFEKML